MNDTVMTSHAGWKWYGYAGHFICGSKCAFHLATRVNGFLISTVGDYRPDGKKPEPLGAEKDSLFETFVFRCGGDDIYGNPNIADYAEIDVERYAKSNAAERGHYRYCEKYANWRD